MINKILVLTRWQEVSEISNIVNSYCEKLDICTFDVSPFPHLGKNYDLIISYCYAPIIKQPFSSNCNAPIVNVHPTYLPFSRGIYPIVWASLNDEPFGASLHLIDSEEIDSGAVLDRVRVYLDKNLTLQEARNVLFLNAQSLLKKFLEKYIPGHSISCIKQSELGEKQPYKNREQSVKLYAMLPKGWNTTINQVRNIRLSF